MFKKRKKVDQRRHLLSALDNKLQELIQLREEIEAQENAAQDLAEKKALLQQTIDLTHQIQALRIVMDLFVESK